MTLATSPLTTDQRLVLAERTWEQFKLIQAGFEDFPGSRLFYYNDTIEILMPGRDHEVFKSLIALLLGIFFEEVGVEFEPTGSMTQEREGMASVQADESYCIGASNPSKWSLPMAAPTSCSAIKHWACQRSGFGKMERLSCTTYGNLAMNALIKARFPNWQP